MKSTSLLLLTFVGCSGVDTSQAYAVQDAANSVRDAFQEATIDAGGGDHTRDVVTVFDAAIVVERADAVEVSVPVADVVVVLDATEADAPTEVDALVDAVAAADVRDAVADVGVEAEAATINPACTWQAVCEGKECGVVKTPCGTSFVCTLGYVCQVTSAGVVSQCGDNGVPYKCGSACVNIEQTGFMRYCAPALLNAHRGVYRPECLFPQEKPDSVPFSVSECKAGIEGYWCCP